LSYPIVKNIPRFVSSENYAQSFGFQWTAFGKTQLDSYAKISLSQDRLFSTSGWRQTLKGQAILEAGSGAGRFTEILVSTQAEVYSFDYSQAVEANYDNNGHNKNLTIFQADIFHIPFPAKTFDKVICLGVLQHTPDPELAFLNLSSFVKPGGEIVIDIYAKKFSSLISWRYLLRPITRRMNKKLLFNIIQKSVPVLLPLAIFFQRTLGRFGARLFPISVYSQMHLPYALHKEWSVLDTFDMYAPLYDLPKSMAQVKQWFQKAGLENTQLLYGPNGIIARGHSPRPLK
jgi:SAM-dependent methyltransferase